MLQLRRLVIGEAGRFPDLGRTFYDRGAARSYDALAAAFEQLGARGLLQQVDDPPQAARHINWLIMAEPIDRAMLLGDDDPPTPAELDRCATTGVRVFLAAYGKR